MNVDKIQKVAVIGAGLMGHGIAQELAQGGYEVGLNDVTEEALEKAIVRIRDNYAMLEREGLLSQGEGEKAIGLVQTSVDIGIAIDGADLVIEAVVEDLALKLDIFEKLDAWCGSQTILATNSSSYMPSKIAAATERPEKVVGMHYFNPPFLMPLVEIIKSNQTSDQTAQVAYDLMVKIGKSPVMVQKEVAERLVAVPGDAAYGLPSVKVAYHSRARIVGRVPPSAFLPRPRVDSALVELERLAAPAVAADPEALFGLMRAGFGQRRKMLRAALKGLAPDIEDRLQASDIAPTDRAEQVSLEQFCALARTLA